MLRTTEALDREWRAEHAHSAAGAAAVARWRQAEPALQGLGDLGEVLAQRRDTERSSAVLAALARLHPPSSWRPGPSSRRWFPGWFT